MVSILLGTWEVRRCFSPFLTETPAYKSRYPKRDMVCKIYNRLVEGPSLTDLRPWKLKSRSVVSGSVTCLVCGLSVKFPRPWNSPGKNTGVGCHSLLQGIFRTQGSNLGLSHCRQILYHLSHQGSPGMHTSIYTGLKYKVYR